MTIIIIFCLLLFIVACIQTARVSFWHHEASRQATRADEYGDCLVRLRERYYDERREAQRLRHIVGEKVEDGVRERINRYMRVD